LYNAIAQKVSPTAEGVLSGTFGQRGVRFTNLLLNKLALFIAIVI